MPIKPLFAFLLLMLDIFVPRFVTEDVVLDQQEDGSFVTVGPLACVEPGETFAAICTVCAFTWFGVAWFGWETGNPRPFTGGPSE